MSELDPHSADPRLERASASDRSIQKAHHALAREHSEVNEDRSRVPLLVLGFTSVLIFMAAIYMVRHRGGFDPLAYDARFDPRTAVAAVAVKVDPVAEGEKLFSNCAVCHQPTGLGVPGVFPPLAGSEWVNGTDERVVRILLSGLSGPVKVKENTFGAAQMPAFGPGGSYNFTDEKISFVLSYVRQAWGNKAPIVTPEKVAAIRAKIGQHKPWSEAELLAIP
jgi:mono/diheme cytochrome c family protein